MNSAYQVQHRNVQQAQVQREMPDVLSSTDSYAERFSGAVGRYFLDTQTRSVIDLLSPWQGANVLDVGGGHAQLAGPLLSAGYRVTVVGSTSSCRSRLEALLAANRVSFVESDLLNLPFAARSYDVVVAIRMLAHLERWRAFLEELCRVARQAVIVDYADLRSFNILQQVLFRWKKAIEPDVRSFRCFRRRELAKVLAGCGYGSPLSKPQFFFPMALHRGIDKAPLSRTAENAARWMTLTRWFGSPVILRVVRDRQPPAPVRTASRWTDP